jgi:hypothetical protein
MIDALKDQTYMVRHNPNCPKAFEVRLSGLGLLAKFEWLGTISAQYGRHQPATRDDVGYGDTLEEAAENALSARNDRLERTLYAPQRARIFNKVWREDRL